MLHTSVYSSPDVFFCMLVCCLPYVLQPWFLSRVLQSNFSPPLGRLVTPHLLAFPSPCLSIFLLYVCSISFSPLLLFESPLCSLHLPASSSIPSHLLGRATAQLPALRRALTCGWRRLRPLRLVRQAIGRAAVVRVRRHEREACARGSSCTSTVRRRSRSGGRHVWYGRRTECVHVGLRTAGFFVVIK